MTKCRYYQSCEGFKLINVTCSQNAGMYYEDERPCGTYRNHEENGVSYPFKFKIYEFLNEILTILFVIFGGLFFIFITITMFIYSQIESLLSRMRNKLKSEK